MAKQYDPKKLQYPLTLEDNVFLVGSSWRVFLPGGECHLDRFKMKDRASGLLATLNEAFRRRGGRPRKVEVD